MSRSVYNTLGRWTLTAALVGSMAAAPAKAGGVLTIGMTAGDLPVTTGNPDQGFEGFRFVGWSLYDALIDWDLSSSSKPSDIKPGLATEWHIDPDNHKRWIFTLRQGVKWHDGCDFTADDVVWNFKRISDQTSPQFYTQQFALARAYLTNFDNIAKVDDHTVAITTKFVESLFPYDMSYVLMVSRCRAEALKYDWDAYASHPSGTGPYKFVSATAHERMEFEPNKDYWDKSRVPQQDKLILLPMPEAATRTAALLSGQVNFIEAPAPDAIPVLKRAGMQIITNTYPHNWPYILNFTRGPFTNLKIRQAANYAINRDDVVDLVGGLATPEYAEVPPTMPYYGHPVIYKFDKDKAHALLKEAGCLPCKITLAISTSGSGQMQSLPMNELVKQQLEDAGFEVSLSVMDWNTMLDLYRAGVTKSPQTDALNFSRSVMDPLNAIIKPAGTAYWAPAGSDWGHFGSPDVDAQINAIFEEFDPAKRLALLAKLNETESEQALMVFIVHDLNPRALSPKLHGYVEAQSWFQDLTPITVDP
jgi:ABC-type transport system substrate-binding protein